MIPIANRVCTCGHDQDDHGRNGSCLDDDCDCGGFDLDYYVTEDGGMLLP